MNRIKILRFVKITLLLIFSVACVAGGFYIYLDYIYRPNIVYQSNQISKHRVAIVPGASVIQNEPSITLAERLEKAIELYRLEKVEKLLLSGDHSGRYYDEVSVMKNYCLKRDVAPEDIFIDHLGLRTFDTIYRARNIFELKKAVFISQTLYLPRVLFIAQDVDINLQAYAANTGRAAPDFFSYLREFAARSLAFIDVYILEREAQFLGPQMPIRGDGRKSWDG